MQWSYTASLRLCRSHVEWVTSLISKYYLNKIGGISENILLYRSGLLKDGMATFFHHFLFREESTLTDCLESTFPIAHWPQFFLCACALTMWPVKWGFRTGSDVAFTAWKIFRSCVLEAVLPLDEILKISLWQTPLVGWILSLELT